MTFYYMVRQKDGTVYTIKAHRHIIKEHLDDKDAQFILPLDFIDYIKLRLKFKRHITIK